MFKENSTKLCITELKKNDLKLKEVNLFIGQPGTGKSYLWINYLFNNIKQIYGSFSILRKSDFKNYYLKSNVTKGRFSISYQEILEKNGTHKELIILPLRSSEVESDIENITNLIDEFVRNPHLYITKHILILVDDAFIMDIVKHNQSKKLFNTLVSNISFMVSECEATLDLLQQKYIICCDLASIFLTIDNVKLIYEKMALHPVQYIFMYQSLALYLMTLNNNITLDFLANVNYFTFKTGCKLTNEYLDGIFFSKTGKHLHTDHLGFWEVLNFSGEKDDLECIYYKFSKDNHG